MAQKNGALINTALAKSYYEPMRALAAELGLSQENILNTLLKLPDVIAPSTEIITEDEWQFV